MFGRGRELDEVEEAVRAKLIELADEYEQQGKKRIELWENGDRADYSPPSSSEIKALLDDPVMYKESWPAVQSLYRMRLIKLYYRRADPSGARIWEVEVTQATRTGHSRISGCWVWALIAPAVAIIWGLFKTLDVLAGVADFFERVKNLF